MHSHKTIPLALILLAVIMLPAVFTFANAQTSHAVEEQLVSLTQKSKSQIEALIAQINAYPNATQKIQEAHLTSQFEGNLTLYETVGLAKLSEAQKSLESTQYTASSDSALQALAVFRAVYASLQSIMSAAGIPGEATPSNQGIIDAIDSEIQRLSTLKEILPANTSQNSLNLLTQANQTLQTARALALQNQASSAQTKHSEAKQTINEFFQDLKTQAQQTNSWRLGGYCQTLVQQIQERFAYGKQNGVDFTAALSAKGYQSEAQFIAALKNRIQNAQNQADLQDAIAECQSINQMVVQMEQALNQEISNQQQGQSNAGGAGTGGVGAGNGTGGSSGGNSNATKAGKS